MKRLLYIISVLICTLPLYGGSTFPSNVGVSSVGSSDDSGPSWYCFNQRDNSLVDNTFLAIGPWLDAAASWTTEADTTLSVPLSTTAPNTAQWMVHGYSAFILETLAAAATDCLFSVVSGVPGGAETILLSIATGANSTLGGGDTGGACEASVLGADASTVDDVGDYCVQSLNPPTTVAIGSGIRHRLDDEDEGGVNTCTVGSQAIYLCILAAVSGGHSIR